MQTYMPTVFIEATVEQDGGIHVNPATSDFWAPGTKVLVSISPVVSAEASGAQSLAGTVTCYEDPFSSATALEDWDAR